MTSTKATTEPVSSAQKAWAASTKATAVAFDAIQPARDNLEAAQQALTAANAEALAAVTVKSPDPQAARERIEKACAAIKQAEDNVQWAVLELHAAEAVHEQAHTDEQAARRRVTVAEYELAQKEWSDPNNRERQLLRELTALIAELTPMICDRKDLHDRLAHEYEHLPPDERPQLRSGPLMATSTRFVGECFADLTPELVVAIRAGLETAQTELRERRRAEQFG
jgi:hypothetical protein